MLPSESNLPHNDASSSGYGFDRFAAAIATVVLLLIPIFLLIRNEPLSSPALFNVLRIALGLSAGVLGATIPGFLNVQWTGRGFTVRSGGALALFVLTFLYTPVVFTGQKGADLSQEGATGDVIVLLSSIGFVASIFPILLKAMMLWLKAGNSSSTKIVLGGKSIDLRSASPDEIEEVVKNIRERKDRDGSNTESEGG